MNRTCRRVVGVATVSGALLIGVQDAAGAASLTRPAPPAAAPDAVSATGPAVTGLALASGIVPGDRVTGYPGVGCTPANDGQEVTTLVTVLGPFPVVTFINWICDGATRSWKRR